MPNLLRIDASVRVTDSHSRALADELQARWRSATPGATVIQRDFAKNPVLAIENDTVIGYYTPEENMTPELRLATAQSDQLIAELMDADALLISTPMYNFTVPSVLKAWIDQVVRVHKTFGFDDAGNVFGMVKNKPAYIAVALGAQFTGTALTEMDFLRPYLKSLLGFIGFEQVEIFTVESTAQDEKLMALSKQKTMEEIDNLFARAVA